MEIERGIAAGCASTDDNDIRGQDLHYSTPTAEPARMEPLLSSVMRGLNPDLIRASIFLRKDGIAAELGLPEVRIYYNASSRVNPT